MTPDDLKDSLLMLEEIIGHESGLAIVIGGIGSIDRLDVGVLDRLLGRHGLTDREESIWQ
jgi:hypothetical protein